MTTAPRRSFEFRLVSSMSKVFPDERPEPLAAQPLTVFAGEQASFQIAWLPPSTRDLSDLPRLRVRIDAGHGARVRICRVALVPVVVAAHEDSDDDFLRRTPGLYPDPLLPVAPGELLSAVLGAWSSVWVDVVVDDPADAGPRRVRAEVSSEDGEVLFTGVIALAVEAVRLPPLDITVAQWLHTDSLADHYAVSAFGDRHWELIEAMLPSLRAAGGNSLLTPLWTPPLDTAVGHRRTSTQLLDVRWDGTHWDFGLARLDRWIGTALRHGISTLEMPHLFTQWGAEATPSVLALTGTGEREVFGWHTAATDPRYRAFLAALIPRLRAHLADRWPQVRTLWHVSDEPGADKRVGYLAAREVVRDLLEGETVIDALSDRSFLTSGVVDVPVVASDAVQPFTEAGDRFWLYYCNVQDREVANRFIAMPGWRTRAIGRQLFDIGASGFLHWGFNFWSSQLSRHPVDPWRDPSAGGAFPAGDPFIVYPGADGRPVESVRHRLFAQAMADHQVLQLLRERGVGPGPGRGDASTRVPAGWKQIGAWTRWRAAVGSLAVCGPRGLGFGAHLT